MFTVIQVRNFIGHPLHEPIVRTVYAVDRATNSFLVMGTLSREFIWIPIEACVPVYG